MEVSKLQKRGVERLSPSSFPLSVLGMELMISYERNKNSFPPPSLLVSSSSFPSVVRADLKKCWSLEYLTAHKCSMTIQHLQRKAEEQFLDCDPHRKYCIFPGQATVCILKPATLVRTWFKSGLAPGIQLIRMQVLSNPQILINMPAGCLLLSLFPVLWLERRTVIISITEMPS